jgi:hypothetical protein
MYRTVLKISLLLVLCLSTLACSAPAPTIVSNAGQASGSAQPGSSQSGELRYKAPEGWTSERTTSQMRVAQYLLPKAEGDGEDAQLVLYYFGQGQGGSVEANLERWIGQMEQSDGRPSKEKAKTETMTVNGLKTTVLDVAGRYTAEMTPGGGSRHDKTNYRMRAAVIETPKGAYFIKLVGPEKTIARWDQSFNDYVKSFEFK